MQIQQHDGVVVELVVFLQGFAKLYGGGGGVGGGEGCAREEVWLPSHPSTIYRGKGRGGGALGFPLGGGGQADWISLGKILGRLAPQAKQVEACLPSQVEAPHLPK